MRLLASLEISYEITNIRDVSVCREARLDHSRYLWPNGRGFVASAVKLPL